jgi:DNA polymerase-3 subunit chi
MDLWTLSPTDFIAHCVQGSSSAQCALSPVLLCTGDDTLSGQHMVLVNLLGTVPSGFELFQRVIEVVSTDEPDRQLARLRWKHYAQAGYVLMRHDLALKGAGA